MQNRDYSNIYLYEMDKKSVVYYCVDAGNFITIYKPNWFRKVLLKILGIKIDMN